MPIRLTSPLRRPSSESLPPYTKKTRLRKFRDLCFVSPVGRALLATLLVWLVAFVFSQNAFWRDPHSWFFDSDRAYTFEYTNHRRQEARSWVTAANDSRNAIESFRPHSNNEPVICAGIATVKRRGVQYLNGTVGSMLAGLTAEERSAVNVRLLFANTSVEDPQGHHPNYNETWLRALDSWGPYNLTEDELDTLKQYQRENTWRKKWTFDYTYLIEQCYNETSAPYIAVVEDDVIFADGWLAKALDALAKVREKSTLWLYLRLFYTESQLGWDKGVDSWYTNPIFSFVLALSICVIVAFTTRIACKRWKPGMDHSTHSTIAVITWISIPAFVILLFMIGHDSLLPRSHRLERMDTKGCCNQALVYHRSQVPQMVQWLRESDPGPTDWKVEEFADKMDLARYAVSPPVVQHVGIVSSTGMPKKYTKQTWAFAFENHNPQKLKKQHERLAKEGIWRAEDDLPAVKST